MIDQFVLLYSFTWLKENTKQKSSVAILLTYKQNDASLMLHNVDWLILIVLFRKPLNDDFSEM